jgi:hypothetical protein
MAQPTIKETQAVDPVLTNMLVAYMQNSDRFVASRVFPPVSVDKDSGTYYIATKKHWFLDELEVRAPGAPFPGLGYGVETDTYTTIQYAGEESIADEVRANNQMPMDLERVSVSRLAQLSLIRKERAWAADFMINNVWANTDNNSTTDWDDFANGDPVNDIYTAVRTISNNTGKEGNTLVCGFIVHDALRLHPDILDRLKYTNVADSSTVEQALAPVFGLDNYWVGKASYNSANEGQTFSAAAIIDDDALVCHVAPSAGIMDATAGKTFVWAPGGGIGSLYSARDGLRHADLIQHKEQWDQKVTATDLGYLFLDVV